MTTKEFEKQTLDQLLIDLKDIDNYKSFREGAFVYDLGHYQGLLLVNEIERLNNIINELENYTSENIEVLENRLNSPFCNFEKVTKELLIFQNYLYKLKELKEENNEK